MTSIEIRLIYGHVSCTTHPSWGRINRADSITKRVNSKLIVIEHHLPLGFIVDTPINNQLKTDSSARRGSTASKGSVAAAVVEHWQFHEFSPAKHLSASM